MIIVFLQSVLKVEQNSTFQLYKVMGARDCVRLLPARASPSSRGQKPPLRFSLPPEARLKLKIILHNEREDAVCARARRRLPIQSIIASVPGRRRRRGGDGRQREKEEAEAKGKGRCARAPDDKVARATEQLFSVVKSGLKARVARDTWIRNMCYGLYIQTFHGGQQQFYRGQRYEEAP